MCMLSGRFLSRAVLFAMVGVAACGAGSTRGSADAEPVADQPAAAPDTAVRPPRVDSATPGPSTDDVRDALAPTRHTGDGMAEDGRALRDVGYVDAGYVGDLVAPAELPTLAGMVLLLDGARGMMVAGDKVVRWEDQSTAKNHAFMDTAALQPTFVARGANGFPAVHFTGKKDPTSKGGNGGPFLRIKDSASLNWGTDDWLIEVVVAYDNPLDGTHNGVLGAFYGKWGNGVEILFCGNWPVTEKTEQAALHIGFGEFGVGMQSKRLGLNDGMVRVYGARRNKGVLELRINGQLDRTAANATKNLDMPGVDVGIGSFSGKSATRSLRGDINLMVAVKGATDDATVSALERYLMARYKAAP